MFRQTGSHTLNSQHWSSQHCCVELHPNAHKTQYSFDSTIELYENHRVFQNNLPIA